jgi:hypothetical protein
LLVALVFLAGGRESRAAFESGSTCGAVFSNSTTCRGAFTTSVTATTIQLPPNGILDYTTFVVNSGHYVVFGKNAANTPVIIRTSGNVTINGAIYVTGSHATQSGTAGDGLLGDDGLPGAGGPGGFDGGRGGLSALFGGAASQMGGAGQGIGGGFAGGSGCGWPFSNCNTGVAGGGGSYGTAGAAGGYGGAAGATYGQATLLPIVGGSGGGGGSAGKDFNGGGGGGGAGAILIASSGTITMNQGGRIWAYGANGGSSSGTNCGGGGGGGSGGGVRLVADKLARTGDAGIYATGGSGASGAAYSGGDGGKGIIRLEAASGITGWTTGNTDPAYTFLTPPSKVLVPNNPTLAITTVAGVAVPANPTGSGDVSLPQGTTTATVELAATNIPQGTTVTIYVVPTITVNRSSALSTALKGDSDAATTATASVTLSNGNNVLLASATYTVTELVAMSLPRFNGEYVAKIRVDAEMGGTSKVTYITASGKEYPAETNGQVMKKS